VHGLFAGGTLAYEALLILEPLLGAVSGNLGGSVASPHRIVDLGADDLTRGRAHPMLDATLRAEEIARAGKDPDVAVLLVDVVLGHGAAADPAGDIAPALEAAQANARANGRRLAVVASVVGTSRIPRASAGRWRGSSRPAPGCWPRTPRRPGPRPVSRAGRA
jgi:FdrA protein